MSTDWVHCNHCYCQPTQQRKFFLTSCGHIFCDKCVAAGTKNKCEVCGSSCTTIPLSARMKPDVEICFHDPSDIIKKQHKQLIQVLDFQRGHKQRLAAHRKEQDVKIRSQLELNQRQMEQAMKIEREMLRLKEENGKLRRLLSNSPGPGGAAKCSHRPGTPGGVLSTSSIPSNVRNMVYQNSSQSMSRSSSPYNRLQIEAAKTPQNQQPMTPTRTPPGPARYSIRTPPVNGRIGSVSTPAVGNLTLTPSGTLIRSANTPGGHANVVTPGGRSSPMNMSPVSSRRAGYSTLGGSRSSPYGDASSQGSRTSLLSQSSSQCEPGHRVRSITPGYQHRYDSSSQPS